MGKYESVERQRRRVFEEGRRLRELRTGKASQMLRRPDVIDTELDAGFEPPQSRELPRDRSIRLLQEELAALQAEVALLRAQPRVLDSPTTLSVLLVGRAWSRFNPAPKRASKSWTAQLLLGTTYNFREVFPETIAPGAWLIVQGPGLLSNVVVGDRYCEIIAMNCSDPVWAPKGSRACLRDGVLEQQQLRFCLELRP